MNRLEVQAQIRKLREELETRHKTGVVKIATKDGTPAPTEELQDQLFSLIYKLSKME